MNCAEKLLEPTIFFNLYTKSPSFFYWSTFSKLVSTHTDNNEVLLKFFGLLKLSLILVIQLKSYEIETVHDRGYLFFETMKIAQISH